MHYPELANLSFAGREERLLTCDKQIITKFTSTAAAHVVCVLLVGRDFSAVWNIPDLR